MAKETPRRAMYTSEKMERQLRKGNVAEAMFRLWVEEKAGDFPQLVFLHQGYNPSGVVDTARKRELLLTASDPDFAVSLREDPSKLLLGISINSQKGGYTAKSTMGGGCIPCSRAMNCYEGRESNLWYNRYNIINDYPQFRSRLNGIDVVLVTWLTSSIDNLFKLVQRARLDDAILDFINGGSPAIADAKVRESLLHLLRYGGRRGTKTPLRRILLWLLHSELSEGKIHSSVTGGISQFGRPREVVCVKVGDAHDEGALIALLKCLGR